jgi:hypothetical protein
MNNYQIPHYKEQNRNSSTQEFADEIADTFFPDNRFEMLNRTQDSAMGFVRSSQNPDFHFSIREEPNIHLWVECKFLELYQLNETIRLFNKEEISRYQSFQNSFLFLCVKIQREQYYYFLPFNHIRTNEMHFSFLNSYIVFADPSFNTDLIKKYLR